MYQAIKHNKLEIIKFLLDTGTDVNAPLWKTGSFAGYTALHVACMKNKDELVELLVSDYKANVNVVAEDGTHSVHLACFYERFNFVNDLYTRSEKLRFLLEADANADVEFGREIFTKHVKDEEWCPDFGEKMTPLIYTIVNKKPELARYLMRVSSDLKVKSLKNKTLLMYALEYNLYEVGSYLINAIADRKYMNLQDDDGIPTIHHMLHLKKYNQYRYDSRELKYRSRNKNKIMMELIEAGADKFALVNGDPDTFLPNVVAYRSYSNLLQGLLTCYDSMPLSKVLYNAMLPIDASLYRMVCLNGNNKPDDYSMFMRRIREETEATSQVALKDLIFRRTFGLQINKEEMKLMESLIATDEEIKNIADNIERKFINGELKRKFVDVNGKTMSIFDFLKEVLDRKKLKLWVSDKIDCHLLRHMSDVENDFYYDYVWLNEVFYRRIENGCKRFELLKKLDKLLTLRKFIDLPYEIILDFLEYLNNDDLNAFINAFMC